MPRYFEHSVDAGFDALKYGYANVKTIARDPRIHGERDLWCAVIAQAFVDIGAIAPPTGSSDKARGKEFDEALRWLLRDKSDFPYVCDQAGVSPHIIRCAARIFYGRLQLAMGAVFNG